MNTAITEAAMCLWEAMIEADREHWKGEIYGYQEAPSWVQIMMGRREQWGTVQMRHVCIALAPHASRIWEALRDLGQESHLVPFDWEFCPAFLAALDWREDAHDPEHYGVIIDQVMIAKLINVKQPILDAVINDPVMAETVRQHNTAHAKAAMPPPLMSGADFRALLMEAVNDWPPFDTDDEVNGGDLVEWFAAWRRRVKEALGMLSPSEAQAAEDWHAGGIGESIPVDVEALSYIEWQQEVANGDTVLGHAEWVAHRNDAGDYQPDEEEDFDIGPTDGDEAFHKPGICP